MKRKLYGKRVSVLWKVIYNCVKSLTFSIMSPGNTTSEDVFQFQTLRYRQIYQVASIHQFFASIFTTLCPSFSFKQFFCCRKLPSEEIWVK